MGKRELLEQEFPRYAGYLRENGWPQPWPDTDPEPDASD